MKAKSSHSGVMQLPRNRESLRSSGVRVVKSRIETGDLRQIGSLFKQPTNWREVMRLVKRREWNQLFKRRHCVSINNHGLHRSLYRHAQPVADPDKWHACEL